MKKIIDTIDKAIQEKKALILRVKHGLGSTLEDIGFEPYIYGDDTLQYPFVWGYLSHSGLFYKLLLDHIISAKLTEESFSVRPEACYQYALEEEHFSVLKGFSNVYGQEARISKG